MTVTDITPRRQGIQQGDQFGFEERTYTFETDVVTGEGLVDERKFMLGLPFWHRFQCLGMTSRSPGQPFTVRIQRPNDMVPFEEVHSDTRLAFHVRNDVGPSTKPAGLFMGSMFDWSSSQREVRKCCDCGFQFPGLPACPRDLVLPELASSSSDLFYCSGNCLITFNAVHLARKALETRNTNDERA